VIHLLSPLTLDGRFSAQDLPEELQFPLLNSIVVPRVVSSSMRPTIQEGDRLALSPPTSLTPGAIVVFRNDNLLICHRITAVDQQGILSTRGDATDGACENVQPSAVIGLVTGILRKGAHLPLGHSHHRPSAAARLNSLKSRVRAVVVRSVTQGIRFLASFPLFHHLLALVLRWAATVDVLTPAPLQLLPSYSTVASFPLRMFPDFAGRISDSKGEKSTQYIIRLGSWRLAQYDQTTESLLLRQSFRDAGLEPLVQQLCTERPATPE